MIIVKILGGLGNQMFQYAFYKSLQKKGYNVYADLADFEKYPLHNGYELERVFNLKLKIPSNFVHNLLKPNQTIWIFRKLKRIFNLKNTYRAEETEFRFDPSFLAKQNRYYFGYWQNEEYFKDISSEIKNDFKFTHALDVENKQILEKILNTESVGIHVRRGDYLKDSSLGNICNLSYYQKSVDIINTKVKNLKFFVFSDEIEWCKQNLPLNDATYIYWNKGSNSFIDMQLMSNCKHNIIANSSFSWWAAWLNNDDRKIIIAPKTWTNHPTNNSSEICPKNWTQI